MSQKDDLLKAVWLAAMAAGGTLRIGPSLVEDYPGANASVMSRERNDRHR